eukprot:2213372-Amphidinium_carterae.1
MSKDQSRYVVEIALQKLVQQSGVEGRKLPRQLACAGGRRNWVKVIADKCLFTYARESHAVIVACITSKNALFIATVSSVGVMVCAWGGVA